MKKGALFFVFVLAAFCCGADEAKISGLPEHDGRLVVKYKAETITAGLEAAYEKVMKLKKAGQRRYSDFSVYIFNTPQEALAAAEEIIKSGMAEFAEPDYIRRALYTPLANGPNDTAYQAAAQYGYALVRADHAFSGGVINPSQNITVAVAVLDSGIGRETVCHADLAAITVNGYNAINPAVEPFDDDLSGGHGTHCAGIIAANTNNSTGMAGCAFTGVTWSARVLLMPVKILDEEGNGYDSDVFEGVKWAVDNGAKVLNYSFGGYSPSQVLRNAMNYASSRGCINVAAAGNDSQYTYYPAAYPNVISTASCGETSLQSSFSNFGKIDVTAPGEQIYSTSNTGFNSYSQESGTSFAAPFVSGLAALMFIKYPDYTADKIRDIIEKSCDDIGPVGYDTKTGWGLINFTKALAGETGTVTYSETLKTYPWPNPFSPANDINTNITIINPGQFNGVKVEIYDASGAKIWEKSMNLEEGYNYLSWDGKTAAGKNAANGTYFYVIKSPQISGRNKITIVH